VVRLIAALRPGGVLIASVPTTPVTDLDPESHRDFTEAGFRAMLERYGMHELDHHSDARSLGVRRPGLAGYYLHHPAAVGRRVAATLRHGRTSRHLTIAWRRGLNAARARAHVQPRSGPSRVACRGSERSRQDRTRCRRAPSGRR